MTNLSRPLSRMSLSEAYGGKPSYTILTLSQYQEDMKRMGQSDKLVYENTMKVDDDLCLADLIATIKNLPLQENDSLANPVVAVPQGIQP